MDKSASRKASSKTTRSKCSSKNYAADDGESDAKEALPRSPFVGKCRIKRGNGALAAAAASGKRPKTNAEPLRRARAAAVSAEKKNQAILSLEVQDSAPRRKSAAVARSAKTRRSRVRGRQNKDDNAESGKAAKEDKTSVGQDAGEPGHSGAADPVGHRQRDEVVEGRPGGRDAGKVRKCTAKRMGKDASDHESLEKGQGRGKDESFKRKTGGRNGDGPRKRRGRPLASQSPSSSEASAAEAKDLPSRKRSRGAPSPGAKKAAGKTSARNGKTGLDGSLLLRRSTRKILSPDDDPSVESHAQMKEEQRKDEGDGAMEDEEAMDVEAPPPAPGETAYHQFLAEKREETLSELKEEAKANGSQEVTIQDLFVAVHRKYCSLDRATRSAYRKNWRMAQKDDKGSS